MPSRRVLLAVLTTVVALGVLALALPAGSGAAASTPNFCASIGLTNAAVRPILGPHVRLSIYPNRGQDLGLCLISDVKGRDPNATVEVYPAVLAPMLVDAHGGGATSRKHLKGLTEDAQLVTGKNNGYRTGGPTVFFATASDFVTIDGYPAATLRVGKRRRVKPATTAAQVTRLARLIYRHVR